jgi:hypothetical protein
MQLTRSGTVPIFYAKCKPCSTEILVDEISIELFIAIFKESYLFDDNDAYSKHGSLHDFT